MPIKTKTKANRQAKTAAKARPQAKTAPDVVGLQSVDGRWSWVVDKGGQTTKMRTNHFGEGVWEWTESGNRRHPDGWPVMEYKQTVDLDAFSLAGCTVAEARAKLLRKFGR